MPIVLRIFFIFVGIDRMTMKRVLVIIFSILLLSSCGMYRHQSLRIINGVFFTENPEPLPDDVPVFVGVINDKKYGKIQVLNHPVSLSEEAMAYAVPVRKVKNGASILETSKTVSAFPVSFSTTMPDLQVGDVFPDFRLSDNKGNEWTLDDFKGKRVMVNFWYTGCRSCCAEMPQFGSWVSKYPDVLFVAMTFQNAEQIRKTVTERGFHFHQLVEATELMETIGIGTYPLTLILDEESRVVLLEVGTSPVQRARIERALCM